MDQKTVAGEPIEVLQAALAKMTHKITSDGMVEISLTLEPELGEPLQRALLRIEKELLDHDMAHGGPELRTPRRNAWPMPLSSSRSASRPGWISPDAAIT
jgi:hypothetical protein